MKHTHFMLRKILVLFTAAMTMALGAALYFHAGFGSDPVSTLCDGLYRTWNIPRGAASFLINGGIFCAFIFIDRHYINLGSVFVSFGVGPFITLFEAVLEKLLPEGTMPLIAALCLPLLGSAIIALGRALYLPCECGAAPLDMIILTICNKMQWTYRKSFSVVSAAIFLIGIFLHGAWGYGTLVAIIFTGWIADFYMGRWKGRLRSFVGISQEEASVKIK
ncbi:MAG: hypothetical protein DBY17_09095 [Oscillospiraceae bacterium]|nr:MAG: hypothetical protein DBY17_09095 [Oscillospiraceae bacterium]